MAFNVLFFGCGTELRGLDNALLTGLGRELSGLAESLVS